MSDSQTTEEWNVSKVLLFFFVIFLNALSALQFSFFLKHHNVIEKGTRRHEIQLPSHVDARGFQPRIIGTTQARFVSKFHVVSFPY